MNKKFNPTLNKLRSLICPPDMSGKVTVSQDLLGEIYDELEDLYVEHYQLSEELAMAYRIRGHTKTPESFWTIHGPECKNAIKKRYTDHGLD